MVRASVGGRTITVAAAALLAALAAGYLLFCVYQDVLLARQPATVAVAAERPQAAPQGIAVAELISARLFGQPVSAGPVAKREEEEAPETRLSLELRGVFSSSNAEASSALIAEKGKSAKYYHVGDKLPGGASLDRVAASHVELRRNGRLERLSFSPPGSSPASSRVARPRSGNPPPELNYSARPSTPQGEKRVESLRERLRQLREAQQEQGDD
ncbi:MAG: hypothetical protein GYB33_20335 [Gammaproteobacteria bacterium]|uniref:type II secretion system protein N n=1 Tax=Pseudomaricurvus alcaniphilus TaxID=1166482 RepID=UPI00140E8A94|nr:type II secretion system protein N [Pseudomaricurvus alcaniphilus]MBR9912695.1 hypothetical protein [Gammaproteobacteria bacterium]NHN38927.1 hypothetical protein [Pseudomaricurvus alcaniphilus]